KGNALTVLLCFRMRFTHPAPPIERSVLLQGENDHTPAVTLHLETEPRQQNKPFASLSRICRCRGYMPVCPLVVLLPTIQRQLPILPRPVGLWYKAAVWR